MQRHTPEAVEEPPSSWLIESYNQYKKSPDSLEGLAVTDPRDPFVWLNKQTLFNPSVIRMSPQGKNLLWFLYRLNGHFPESDTQTKWRDNEISSGQFMEGLTRIDDAYAQAYQAHLDTLMIEDAQHNAETIEAARQGFERQRDDEAAVAYRQAKLMIAWGAIKVFLDEAAERTPIEIEPRVLDSIH